MRNQNNQVFGLSNREKNVQHKKDCWLILTGFLKDKKAERRTCAMELLKNKRAFRHKWGNE